MESYKSNIQIYFKINRNIDSGFLPDDIDQLEKQLNSLYIAIKGDIQSTPDFDTRVTISRESNSVILNITGNNVSKFRATILSFLRLVDLSYSVIQVDNR